MAGQHRERVEQQVVPLAGDHRSHREQCPGRRSPRREAGGVGTGLGDVDAIARQRVELHEHSAGPRARRDDRRAPPTAQPPRVLGRRHPRPAPTACARARPAAGGPPAGPARRAPSTRRGRRAGRLRRRGSPPRGRRVRRARLRPAAATIRSLRVRAPSSRRRTRPLHTRRSNVLPPLGVAGSSIPSGTTMCTALIAHARSSPRRCATRAA